MSPRLKHFAAALCVVTLGLAIPCQAQSEGDKKEAEKKAEPVDANTLLLKKVKVALDAYYDAKLSAEIEKKAFDVQKAWDAAAASAGFVDRKDLEAKVATARKAGGATFQKGYQAELAAAKARYETRAKAERAKMD